MSGLKYLVYELSSHQITHIYLISTVYSEVNVNVMRYWSLSVGTQRSAGWSCSRRISAGSSRRRYRKWCCQTCTGTWKISGHQVEPERFSDHFLRDSLSPSSVWLMWMCRQKRSMGLTLAEDELSRLDAEPGKEVLDRECSCAEHILSKIEDILWVPAHV